MHRKMLATALGFLMVFSLRGVALAKDSSALSQPALPAPTQETSLPADAPPAPAELQIHATVVSLTAVCAPVQAPADGAAPPSAATCDAGSAASFDILVRTEAGAEYTLAVAAGAQLPMGDGSVNVADLPVGAKVELELTDGILTQAEFEPPNDSEDDDSQGDDSQGDDSQGDDSQGDDSQDEDSQDDDSQDEDSQDEDSQDEDSQDEDSQDEDSQGDDSQGDDSQGDDSQDEDSQHDESNDDSDDDDDHGQGDDHHSSDHVDDDESDD